MQPGFEIPKRDYKVIFEGGPYDGREGALPFLPTFIAAHDMDGDFGSQGGTLTFDWRLSKYVYMLIVRDDDETKPSLYRYQPDGAIDAAKWLNDR